MRGMSVQKGQNNNQKYTGINALLANVFKIFIDTEEEGVEQP